jgi:hypothetical protein
VWWWGCEQWGQVAHEVVGGGSDEGGWQGGSIDGGGGVSWQSQRVTSGGTAT